MPKAKKTIQRTAMSSQVKETAPEEVPKSSGEPMAEMNLFSIPDVKEKNNDEPTSRFGKEMLETIHAMCRASGVPLFQEDKDYKSRRGRNLSQVRLRYNERQLLAAEITAQLLNKGDNAAIPSRAAKKTSKPKEEAKNPTANTEPKPKKG